MNNNKAASLLARSKIKKISRRRLLEAASTLGRAGGLVGGYARADVLDQPTRTEIASHAANTRWGNPCGCSFCRRYA